MLAVRKRYTTSYKKKVDLDRDTFLPRRSPKGVLGCAGCGAVFYRRHWTAGSWNRGLHAATPMGLVFCPACKKIKAHRPSGELELTLAADAERGEVLRILRNEEQKAREKNPLERIMRLYSTSGSWKVETTTEKLAQRLGRAVHKARGGSIEYKWSHNNKFVRVLWHSKATIVPKTR